MIKNKTKAKDKSNTLKKTKKKATENTKCKSK